MTNAIVADLPAIVFMKVGTHAGESFEQIMERKNREFQDTGRIFWGYGGGTMHPIQRVQPFAQMKIEQGLGLTLVMQSIISRHPPTEAHAIEYSSDGIHWEPIPKGIRVQGSRYALVLDEIKPSDLSINLADYRVGIGPSAGKIASQYIQGRVDKGCLEHIQPGTSEVEPKIITVGPFARLQPPYAVVLR
jgi:hypothetical protein